MAQDVPLKAAVYRLPLDQPDSAGPAEPGQAPAGGFLPPSMLLGHALWFCRLRWLVIAALAGFYLLGHWQAALVRLQLRIPGAWPLVVAGGLTVSNVLFRIILHVAARPGGAGRNIMRDLYGQIIVDLLALTVVVHFVGSTETFFAFVYLFHIVLACVVLSRRQSFMVTALAIALYAGCVLAEQFGPLRPATIFVHGPMPRMDESHAAYTAVNSLSAMALWLAAWHLTSRLCRRIRQRDLELARTNRRLLAAQVERARHMLATTHQLRAPFAAIAANAQILQEGYCGELPEPARPVVQRIIARCGRLAGEIQEMLQLANLRSEGDKEPALARLDLADILAWCLDNASALAQRRSVTILSDVGPAAVIGVPDHLKMLLSNVLHNAVVYSHEGGEVRVTCRREPGGEALVTVADDGIGIVAEKLPHIFDEHYRTVEAMRHQRESSGLGLAIVRDVARLHEISVTVASADGAGTTVELRFPVSPPSEAPQPA